MKRSDAWMPLYIGDYLGDTLHLTRDQHGGYLLLIMAYWRNGGPLPDDDRVLGAIVKATPREWKKLRTDFSIFFKIRNGLWHHARIDAELVAASYTIEKRTIAGKKGAAARWKTHGKRNAIAMRTQCPDDGPSPSSSSLRSEEDSVAYATGADAPSFDPVKEIFDRGLKILGQAQRSLLGKLRKQHGDVAVLEAICACESEHPTDPAPFLIRSCKAHSAPKRKSPSTTLWEGAYNAAQNYIRDHGIDRDDNLPAQPLLDSGRPPRIA